MHPHLILDTKTCEEISSLKNKITAIIATSQSQINIFMWSILSLLMKSDPNDLEHIIVCINGPDNRTGNPELQDKKQKFLEELRQQKWHNRDMPLTISRVWSRLGHAQALDSAIPWVHTQYYLLMHDDIIIQRNDWSKIALNQLSDSNVAISYFPPKLLTGVGKKTLKGQKILDMPHMNSTFLVCNKPMINSLGVNWYGYHLEKKFKINELIDSEEFFNYHLSKNQISTITEKAHADEYFDVLSMDIGTHVNESCEKNQYKMLSLPSNILLHFIAASWQDPHTLKTRINSVKSIITEFEIDLMTNSEFASIYQKYKER